MTNRILSTGRRIGIIVIVFLSINLMVSHASANLFEVTYEVTFTDLEFQVFIDRDHGPPIFGQLTGPVDASASFLIETGAAPDIFYQAGETYHIGNYDLTARHDFYIYNASRVSELSCTFGTKTWDTNDISPFNVSFPKEVWFDRPLADGATPMMRMFLEDSDGRIELGGAGSGPGDPGPYPEIFLYDMTSVGDFLNHEEIWKVLAPGAIVSVRAITPVPEPSTMLLLGSGLIGLAGYGRRKFFKK